MAQPGKAGDVEFYLRPSTHPYLPVKKTAEPDAMSKIDALLVNSRHRIGHFGNAAGEHLSHHGPSVNKKFRIPEYAPA